MALIKTGYKNGAGVGAEYWRIIDYRINTQLKYVDMTFGGWLNEECRLANMELSDTPRKVRCLKDKFDEYFGTNVVNGDGVNSVLQMYKFAKENDEFFMDGGDLLDSIVEGEPVVVQPSSLSILERRMDESENAILMLMDMGMM